MAGRRKLIRASKRKIWFGSPRLNRGEVEGISLCSPLSARQTGNNLRMIIVYVLMCISSTFSFAAEDLPTSEDVNNLSIKAGQLYNAFLDQTGELRLKYDFCNGQLNDSDRQTLSRLARQTTDALADIEAKQDKLKARIEQYDGADWEKRYGSTGLWRKIIADLYETCLSEGETGIYYARTASLTGLTADKQQRQVLLEKILEKLKSLEERGKSARLQFSKAKVMASLCEYDSQYLPPAKNEFENLLQNPQLDRINILRIELDSIRLLGENEPGRLDSLEKKIIQSDSNEISLILSLVRAQRKLNRQQDFQKTIKKWPQIESVVGSLLLYELGTYELDGKFDRQALQKATAFEACLAVKSAQAQGPEKYKTLLDALTKIDKFHTPLILYAAAAAWADEKPDKAIDLLISAASLHKAEPSDNLEIEPEQIARQAVALACQKYSRNLLDCDHILKTYDDYQIIAGGIKDKQLTYNYIHVLERCGRQEKADSLLKELAETGKGYWSKRAALDLIEKAIEQNKKQNLPLPEQLLVRIADFIEQCGGNEQNTSLESEALSIYCRTLLEQNKKERLQEVAAVLTEDRLNNDPNLNCFKAIAFCRLERPGSSADYFLRAWKSPGCQIVPEVMELLSTAIEQIDQLQEEDKFPETAENCKKLALNCCRCLEGSQKKPAELLLAEISIFAANGNKDNLAEVEKLLNELNANDGVSEPDLIRCRARLLTGQGKFEQAAKLWEQLSKIYKNEYSNNISTSRHWWQAKYYELFCCFQSAQTDKKQILHTIEVLENTHRQIPDFWAEKLARLKKICIEQQKDSG